MRTALVIESILEPSVDMAEARLTSTSARQPVAHVAPKVGKKTTRQAVEPKEWRSEAPSKLLRFCLAMQFGADRQRIIRIDGAIAFFDMLNHTVLVDYNIGALSPLISLILLIIAFENAIGCQHLLVHVAQQGEFNADLFRKRGVGSG
jgi:hypothetical protein